MSGMFYECNSLNFIDMSNFDMSNCNSYSNMFSSNNNLKFINLYNINDNNNILSNIFNGVSSLYVCTKSNNIISPNIYNCCDYNYESNECNNKIVDSGPQNQYYISTSIVNIIIHQNQYSTDSSIANSPASSSGNPSDTTSQVSPNDNQLSSFSSKSSGSISSGIIIGIIAGVVFLIAIVITIICVCRRMKNKEEKSENIILKDGSSVTIDVANNDTNNDIIIPKNKIIVNLVTTGQIKIELSIEPEKKMRDLIKAYFDKIKKPELFGDTSIRFLYKGRVIEHESNDLIKDYIKKDSNIIVIDDVEDKLN